MAYALEWHNGAGWQPLTADLHTPTPIRVERGIQPGQHTARPGLMQLALHDPTGAYTPDHPGQVAGFTLEAPLRLMLDGTPLFTGRISRITPGGGVTHVEAVDHMAVLAETRLRAFALMLNTGSGAAISALLVEARPPLTPAVIQAGSSTFPFVGDTWREGLPLRTALDDVARSEGGHLWVGADGAPRFTGRGARRAVLTPAATLSADFAALQAHTDRRRLATRVTVTVEPRTIGAGPEVLWRKTTATLLEPGQTRTLVAPYRDPDQQVAEIAGRDLITPTAPTDYTADDNRGADLTGQVSISMVAGARSALLTLTNSAGAKAYVRDLQVRGTALRTFVPVSVTVGDPAAQAAYGLHPLAVRLPLEESTTLAGEMARSLLVQRSTPQPWVTLTLEAAASAAARDHARLRDVGDRLDISAPAYGLAPTVTFIDGVRHLITEGGRSHRVTWLTSPAEAVSFWLVGVAGNSELGQTTRIGY